MIRTHELIDVLAAELKPVRRLRSPVVRAGCWSFMAGMVVVLLGVSQGVRADLTQRVQDTSFTLALGGAAATAIFAAASAFALAVPGRSRLWALLPLPPLLLWITAIGRQCLTRWVGYDDGTMMMGDTARCFATVVLTSLPLWLLMLLMLRRSGAVRRLLPTLAGSLAVAATAGVAMDLLHRLDASAMILLWNFGTGAVIVFFATLFGQATPAPSSSVPR
jgi:hypothetical protein